MYSFRMLQTNRPKYKKTCHLLNTNFLAIKAVHISSYSFSMASTRSTAKVGVRTSSRAPVVEKIVPSSSWAENSTGHYLLVDLPEFKKEELKLQVNCCGRIIIRGERQPNEGKRVHFHLTFRVPVDSDIDKVTGKFDGGILYVTVPKRTAKEQHKESKTEKAENGKVERAEENERQEPNVDNEGRDRSQHDSHGEMEDTRNDNAHTGESNADNEGRDRSRHDSHREMEEIRSENAHTREFSEGLIRKWEHEPMLRSAVEVLGKNKGLVLTVVVAFSLGLLLSSFSR